jgi:hypothetical protein
MALGLHGEDVVLVDVRRTGKTTVALGALEMLATADQMVFALDAADNAPATIDLAERLAAQLAAQQSGFFRASAQLTKGVRTLFEHGRGITGLIGDEELRALVDGILPDELRSQSGVEQLDRVLSRIDAVASDNACRAVVFIDEVQKIAAWPDSDAVQHLLRSRLRQPGGHTSFLFAGSEPTNVETLFRRGGALDFQGIEHRLAPISGPAWFEGLRRAFALLKGEIDDGAIDLILEASENHPLRTMLAAREAHALAETRTPVGHATRAIALQAVDTARGQRLWSIEDTR